MNRSGYSDYDYDWYSIMWRGAVASAIRGKRGQRFLRELIEALDSMETKELIYGELQTKEGGCCALGRVAQVRGIDFTQMDGYDDNNDEIAEKLDIARSLTCEVESVNDNDYWPDDSQGANQLRWERVRAWAVSNLKENMDPLDKV